jgi:hypothetical protein
MMQNILIGILAVIIFGAGALAWWLENGNTGDNVSEKETEKENEGVDLSKGKK